MDTNNDMTRNHRLQSIKSRKLFELDGFPVKCYRSFIDLLAPILLEVYNQ